VRTLVALAVAALMLAASPAADAASCKFKQNEIDDFTQQRLLKIDWVDMTGWMSSTFKRTIGDRKDIEIAAESAGGRSLLKFRLKLSNAVKSRPYERDLYNALYVPAGSNLEIVMADESIIELIVDEEVRGTNRAKYDDGWWVVTSKFTVRYPVGDAPQNLARLALQLGLVIDELPGLDLPLDVRGDEGILVDRLARTFGGPDAADQTCCISLVVCHLLFPLARCGQSSSSMLSLKGN